MELKCTLCGAESYKKRNLHVHLSRIHGVKSDNKNFEKFIDNHHVVRANILCQEEKCEESFPTLCDFRAHLCTFHELKGIENCEKLKFEKYSDFQQWLAEEENNTNVKFFVNSKKKNENHVYTSFWCNRSGSYKPKVESRKRQLKAQGTMKMGFHCTAAIFVKDFDSHVEVSYYKGHYKHEKSLCHVPLPEVEKELIAGKLLLQGVAEKNILQDIRQSLDTSFGRKHLTTRKDLQNIKRDFGIMLPSRGSIIQDDEMSVCAWVDKMKIEKDNPVLFYKRQDDAHPTIQNKDFMLVLMTHFQKSIFYRLGADRICVDSTHSISNYNFELVTVLVIDEYEEGIPVAFCISSLVNTVILTHFF
ncbi:uncharacterized protein LOC129987599 [Argiope bruennichi]|uniref:uncharacterized protein LOC129987599 n=1 Tax=Argiope bruennichi TaxID=94029 RepID=UPI0024951B91|nr:uncharacterized protein LOC129987599 [Argiope bruennichi]